jgi:hypothetical protein
LIDMAVRALIYNMAVLPFPLIADTFNMPLRFPFFPGLLHQEHDKPDHQRKDREHPAEGEKCADEPGDRIDRGVFPPNKNTDNNRYEQGDEGQRQHKPADLHQFLTGDHREYLSSFLSSQAQNYWDTYLINRISV